MIFLYKITMVRFYVYGLFILFFYFSFSSTLYAAISISPLKYELEVAQGTQITRHVKVTNQSENPIILYTSSEDFTAGDDTGKPKFLKPEDQEFPELSLSNWIQLNEKNITLAPFETKEVAFTIRVPENGEPGGHYGAIFFSPGIQSDVELGFSKRIGILILVNVPGDVLIDGELDSFHLGSIQDNVFLDGTSFDILPIVFKTNFENKGNIHLKPKGKIELIDHQGVILKNIGKETLVSPNGAFIGEKLVDYIPINSVGGNVLPYSKRSFESLWEGFGYNVINEDGTKGVDFQTIEDYYLNNSKDAKTHLRFWEAFHIRSVKKPITAAYNLEYIGKDSEKKVFSGEKTFVIHFKEKYIGLNYIVIILLVVIIGGGMYIYIYVIPKIRRLKEAEMREKIMKELNNK